MKLRIRGNSLRLRLTRTEVSQLASQGACAETMMLDNGEFRYGVVLDAIADTARAAFEDGTLSVTLDRATVQLWAAGDAVSLRGRHGPLSILVEKDFTCLQPRDDEDESDLFPHPAGASK